MINELKQFANRCRDCEMYDTEEFQALMILTEKLLGLTSMDIAKEVMISRSTVERWKDRKNAPHPYMRAGVLRIYERKALERVIALGGKVS